MCPGCEAGAEEKGEMKERGEIKKKTFAGRRLTFQQQHEQDFNLGKMKKRK